MRRDPMKDPLPVEAELRAEKAATLGLAGEQLEAAIGALAALDAELRRGDLGADERGALAARRERMRLHAAERLWNIVVQREALGVRDHEPLYRTYRVPEDIKRYAGPRG